MSKEALYKEMVSRGWSEEGAAFIVSKAEKDDPKFFAMLRRRLLGEKSARSRPKTKKAAIPSSLRKRVFERDAYRCLNCGDWHNLSIDHVVPESKGGPTTFDNLQTLCLRCNMAKGNRV